MAITETNTITLQDLTTPTGSRFYSGKKIYCLGAKLSYGMKISIGNKPSTLANPDNIDTDYDTLNLNFSRRKGYTQYTGITNPELSLEGGWTTDIGSQIGAGSYLLTPFRLMKLALGGHSLYINGGELISNFKSGDETYGALHTSNGIPVIIEDVSIDTTSNSDKLTYVISFKEDKEVDDTR